MPTLTATAFNSPAYVLVEVDWTDFPDVTHAAVIRRNTVTGEEVMLRPYISYNEDGYLLLNCGQGLWWDTEPPLNVALEYCTVAADALTYVNSNPFFETGIAPWAPTNSTFVQSGAFFHQGAFSGLLTPNGTSNFPFGADNTGYPYTAGVPLTVSGWVFSPQGWNSVVISMVLQSGVDPFTTHSVISTLYPNQWQFFTLTFTPDNNGTITAIRAGAVGIPPNTVLFYFDEVGVRRPTPVAATACDTVTVVNDSVWLKNPLHPCLDVEVGLCDPGVEDCETDSRVSYVGMADDERYANTVLSSPANRQSPIPTNRIRRTPVSRLQVLAHDCTARDAVVAVNQPGDPLLFQAPADYCLPDRYISVATLTESRISIDQREDFRLMTMPYAVVDRPAGPADGICGARIQDLCDIYTSWQAMTLGGLDWRDLLLGLASGQGPFTPEGQRIWGEVETEFANWLAVEAGGTRDWGELRDGL